MLGFIISGFIWFLLEFCFGALFYLLLSLHFREMEAEAAEVPAQGSGFRV